MWFPFWRRGTTLLLNIVSISRVVDRQEMEIEHSEKSWCGGHVLGAERQLQVQNWEQSDECTVTKGNDERDEWCKLVQSTDRIWKDKKKLCLSVTTLGIKLKSGQTVWSHGASTITCSSIPANPKSWWWMRDSHTQPFLTASAKVFCIFLRLHVHSVSVWALQLIRTAETHQAAKPHGKQMVTGNTVMIRSEPSNNVSSNHVQETSSCFVLTSHFLDELRLKVAEMFWGLI